ncbi:MAG: hypothetical protein CM15mP115_00300 [Alphaproteobacteria bacterium]|nr:MAG: hypothetical protein CM15mP115_00300 [Alphaproteobacteria bacterium]
MLLIHTVAAGGGSLCQFDGARFRVGPESAGANPGPACYRRGGPLAVTDCNVMLGKLQPEFFPPVFGPNQDEPLDADAVRARFTEMAAEVEIIDRHFPLAGRACRRLPAHCCREHGQCHQEDLGAARL